MRQRDWGEDDIHLLIPATITGRDEPEEFDWTPERCAACGRDPAEGWAFINDDRYCHGDTREPSCYEQASIPKAWPTPLLYEGGLA